MSDDKWERLREFIEKTWKGDDMVTSDDFYQGRVSAEEDILAEMERLEKERK